MEQNSRMGTASRIISIAVILISAIFAVFGHAGIIGHEMDAVTKNKVVRLWFVGSFIIAVVALGLGIGGLFRKGKRKKYAIIGVSLSIVIIVGIMAFLPMYYKIHYGYSGIENIFFAKPAARSSSPVQSSSSVSIFHAKTLTKEIIDSNLKASKRDICDIQPDQLRYQVNRIYAYYGYPFQKPEIRSLFYYPGSPYHEDSSFSEEKIPADHRTFINYLLGVEKWKFQLAQKRSQGLLDYEESEENRQVSFEGLSALLAVDHRRNRSFMIDNQHLLVLKYPDNIPIGQVKLPASISSASEFSAVLSPNGKYLALRYYQSGEGKCVIILINTITSSILHVLPAGFGENRSHAQFDKSSSVLYTAAGAYDVVAGKKTNQWTYPADTNIRNIDEVLTMYDGLLKDGSLLFGCWALNKVYRVDPSEGVYKIFMDLEKDGLSVPHATISDDSELMAGVASKTKVVGNSRETVRSDFVIWKILPDNSVERIYAEEISRDQPLSGWKWGRQKAILKTTGDKANRYKLWRYDVNGSNVSLTPIPIEGLFGGQNRISLSSFFVSTYGRLWDIETGRKVSPWYEAFDPFDESNLLPLYDKQPRAVQLRDFWQ